MSKVVYLNNLFSNGNFETANPNIEDNNNGNGNGKGIVFRTTAEYHSPSHSLRYYNVAAWTAQYYNTGNKNNHIFYFSCYTKVKNFGGGTVGLYFGHRDKNAADAWQFDKTIFTTQLNTWEKSSGCYKIPDESVSDGTAIFAFGDTSITGNQEYYLDDCLLIDLTACFGFGNEPNQAWCDANIPYFVSEMKFSFPDTTEKTTNFVDVYNTDYISLVKASIIKPKFKIELLDLYENTIGEITKDISADNSGSISINYQQGVRRSCSFTLSDTFGKYRPMSNDNIFGFNTKFKIYVGLENVHTGETYWFSQGIFYTTNPTSSHANSSKTVTVNGVDKFGIFTSDTGYNQLEGTYIVPAKSKLYAVVKDILSLELGNGYMIDPKEPHIDAEFINYELPYDIKKSPGSYMGDILIELGNVLGADIFYDTNGVLNITSGTTDITYSKQSSIWDFSDVLPEYSNGSVSLNTIDAINIVKVVGNQVNDSEIYIGNAENHNPLSPTAIEKIGRKIYYEESANLPNQARADEYARYVLNSKSIIQTAIGFSSTLIPHLDVNRVITITDDYYKYEQERFIIQSITLPLDSKTLMSISCNNIASLPYYDLRNGG